MADLKIIFKNYAPDVNLMLNDLQQELGLTTSVLVSIFSDLSLDGKAGFWGDTITPDQKPTGSRLFSIRKNNESSRVLAAGYLEKCLQWMLDDGVASSIEVTQERVSAQMSRFKVAITQPSGEIINLLYVKNWENEKASIEGLEYAS